MIETTGTAPAHRYTSEDCRNCLGEGSIQCELCLMSGAVECEECDGSGCRQCEGGSVECYECEGAGDIECEACCGMGEACSVCGALPGNCQGERTAAGLTGAKEQP
jgi:hypothetical protein